MTPGQCKTVVILGLWLTYTTVGCLGLLVWEFHTLSMPDHATITETVQTLYAQQQWPFLVFIVGVTAIAAFLGGHFFAAPSQTYEDDRVVAQALAPLGLIGPNPSGRVVKIGNRSFPEWGSGTLGAAPNVVLPAHRAAAAVFPSPAPFPIPSLASQVDAKVAALPFDTATIEVTHESFDDSTRVALMVKGSGVWGFAAWLEKQPRIGNTETGVKVLLNWGGPAK